MRVKRVNTCCDNAPLSERNARHAAWRAQWERTLSLVFISRNARNAAYAFLRSCLKTRKSFALCVIWKQSFSLKKNSNPFIYCQPSEKDNDDSKEDFCSISFHMRRF